MIDHEARVKLARRICRMFGHVYLQDMTESMNYDMPKAKIYRCLCRACYLIKQKSD